MEDSNNKRFNKRHHYTMKEKLEIINYYHAVDEKGNKLHTKSEILKKYNIDHKSLEYWEKNEIKIKDSDNLNKKTLHKGRPNTFTEEEEKKILFNIEASLSENIPLSYIDATKIIMQLHIDSIKNLDISTIYMRVYRLLKKNYFVIRRGTHLGKTLPDDANTKTILFLKEVIKIRKLHDFDLSCIINLDETPVNLDNPNNYCLAKRGNKIVTIKTLGKEKKELLVYCQYQLLEINYSLILYLKVRKTKHYIKNYNNLMK